MITLGASFLQIIAQFLPYLLVFGAVIGLGYLILHKLT